jgi:hypothetical protein
MFLAQLKQQLNLKRVVLSDPTLGSSNKQSASVPPKQFKPPKSDNKNQNSPNATQALHFKAPDHEAQFFVVIEGPSVKVTRAEEELRNLRVYKETVTLPSESMKT